jgi:hypothetical protein
VTPGTSNQQPRLVSDGPFLLPVSDKGSRARWRQCAARAIPNVLQRARRATPARIGASPIRLKASTVRRVKTLHTAYRVGYGTDVLLATSRHLSRGTPDRLDGGSVPGDGWYVRGEQSRHRTAQATVARLLVLETPSVRGLVAI